MPHLEPTYLRYIYDGLVKGSIHPENAAELPDGLIGLYEEAFDERTSVVERQKLLQRFAIWALLKKEVSAAFVAEVLCDTEDEIQNFISTYSAWFNSPESGKYQLYHERLKVYLLQKMSEGEIHGLHEKLISRLEQAIEEQKADEFEWYGLEFLAMHVSVSAMIHSDGQKLLNLAYSQTHWQRQLKISKGFNWTKTGLKAVMTWASKYNDDEVIECGLQMVDLYHQEQNAAPQIVALVADGDFDAALKRIEQFGGNDKEGLHRKFILYMLCLMELTLLKSKDKPFRKEGIEKLLKHLDEQLPVDHSVLNWGEFFSGYLIFQMACEVYEIELGFDFILKRTESFNFKWIESIGPYSTVSFNVMENMILTISDEERKQEMTKFILVGLANHNQFKFINSLLQQVDFEMKDEYLDLIATTLASKRKIKKSIHFALKIKDATNKNLCLIRIINILLEKNKLVEAKEILPLFTIRYYRVASLCLYSNYLFKRKIGNHLNPLNQAIKICETIQNDLWLIMAKRRIAATYITQRKFSKAFGIISKSFKIQTNRDEIKNYYLIQLIDLFVSEKKYDLAVKLTLSLDDDTEKNKEIAKILLLRGKTEEGLKQISIKKNTQSLQELITYLVQKGNYKIAIKLSEELAKADEITNIGCSFLEVGKIELLNEILKSKCKVCWDNPIQQFIQLLNDGYYTWKLDESIDSLLIQYGEFETIKILNWITNNDKFNFSHSTANIRIIELFINSNNFIMIQEALFKKITYIVEPFDHDKIIKKLILYFYTTEAKKRSLKLVQVITSSEKQIGIIDDLMEIENQSPLLDCEKIKEIFIPIIDKISSNDLNIDLTRIYLKLGESKKIEDNIISSSNSVSKINRLIFAAKYFNEKNNVIESKRHINLAIKEIKNQDDNQDKCSWYHEIAMISFNNNDLLKSKTLLKKSIDILRLEDEDFAGMEVSYIVRVLCKYNQFKEAIKLIEEIDEYWQNFNYCCLIPLLISNGKEIFANNIMNNTKKQLNKIELLLAASEGWFGVMNYKKSVQYIDAAILLTKDINDLTEQSEACEAIANKFMDQEKWFNAVDFIEKVSLKQNQLYLAKKMGGLVGSNLESKDIELISNNFYDQNLKLGFWKGVAKEIKLELIDEMMIIHNLKKQNWNLIIFEQFYRLEIIKQIFLNLISLENEEKLVARLNLEWAMEIKNQINKIS